MPSDSQRLAVEAIDHVTLVVADLDRSRAFFADLLGMQEVPRPDFGFPGLWFQAGSTQIHLNIASEEAGRSGLTYDATSITRALHIAFRVDDATAARRDASRTGCRDYRGPAAKTGRCCPTLYPGSRWPPDRDHIASADGVSDG